MSKHLSVVLGAFALGATLLPTTAFAQQYTHDPFFEQTVPQSQAYGFEMIGMRLALAQKFAPPYDDEFVEQIESMSGADLARFHGTLTAASSDLASSLSDALEAVEDAVNNGKDASAAAKSAQNLLSKAYDAVIGADVRKQPSFEAAVLVNLLLADNGVSEGYGEAVENQDPWEYPNGWAALQRAKQLWADIKPLGTAQRQTDGQEMIDALDKLFPNAGPPKSVAGWNSEDAEDPAQRLSGIIEEVADSNLYPDRDLPRLSDRLAEVTSQACEAYTAGDDEIAAEDLFAVFDHYQSHLYDPAGLFAPEVRGKISALFGSLIATGDDEDDEAATAEGSDDQAAVAPDTDDKAVAGGEEDNAAATDDDDQAEAAVEIPDSPVEACGELKQGFIDLKTAFGG
ncbi:MAG TPA: hypothetical protein VGM83_08665 [Devosiaceae bacterium]|jgi:hypothetical protein